MDTKLQPISPAMTAIPAADKPAAGKWRQFKVQLWALLQMCGALRWSTPDRASLKAGLLKLWKISPYLVVIALPGSLLMLPVLAWWLNRRRSAKRAGPAAAG